jgi:hypothetical protein
LAENATIQRPRPHFYNGVSLMANKFVIAAVVLVIGGVLAVAGLWAADNHPDGRNASRVERRIAEIYGRPDEGSDDKIIGDILLERFYAVDPETGQRYVADVVKGRVKEIQNWTNEFGTTFYTLVLERQSLQNQRQALRSYVREIAPPELEPSASYLGIVMQPGASDDAMAVNFDGTLPVGRQPFYVWNRRPMYDTLLTQPIGSIASPQLMPSKGYNFLLSNSELWPYFKTAFNVQKAVWVSEQILVDATSPQHKIAFYQRLGG